MMNTKISTNQLVMFALSLGIWWLLLGSIQMALGFFALIFVHEMGHVIAAKQKGLSVTMPTFTPFGAYVQTERCRSASDPAMGSARMLLHASNHVLRLAGQDIDEVMVIIARVNLAIYAPWGLYNLDFLKGDDVVIEPPPGLL